MKRTAAWLAAVGVVSLIGCFEVGDAGQRDLDGESPEDGADILYQATPTPAKVGMFYLLWHCFSLDRKNPPYSIAEGIATGNWGPIPEFHWWGQLNLHPRRARSARRCPAVCGRSIGVVRPGHASSCGSDGFDA